MKYSRQEFPDRVVLSPASPARASVIWLHGLGANGHDFVPIVPELQLPDTLPVRFVFPHAPSRPVTVNGGYVMPAWYDIAMLGTTAETQRFHEDETGIRASAQRVQQLIEAEVAQGVVVEKIVLAGFSQGGAVVLHAGLRYPQRLAGIMALSTYLPLQASLPQEIQAANRETPVFMAHGTQDQVVMLERGQRSCEVMRSVGVAVEFKEYPMPHSVCEPEIADISGWLQQVLA